jgi:hypothetical protein
MNAFTIMIGVTLTVIAFGAVLLAFQFLAEAVYHRIVNRQRRKQQQGEKRNG